MQNGVVMSVLCACSRGCWLAGNALEVRVEAFNLTNTTPFGTPNGAFGAAAFGTITTAGDPRVFQLAVKFVF